MSVAVILYAQRGVQISLSVTILTKGEIVEKTDQTIYPRKFRKRMDKLSASHLQMQGNLKKPIVFGQSNHGRDCSALRKVTECGRWKQSNPRQDCAAMRRMKKRVHIRTCTNSAHRRAGDSENLSARNNPNFWETDGMNDEEDWRTFRARLVNANLSAVAGKKQRRRSFSNGEWAHEIENVEEGCVLVATEKLKNHPLFSEAVLLVLQWPVNSSTCKGIVLNKMFPYDITSVDLIDPMIRNLHLPAFVGGPAVDGSDFGSKFHVLTRERDLKGFDSVVAGLYAGNMGVSLQSAMCSDAAMRLYVGEVELEKRVVRAQVEAFGWWKMVACSADVIFNSTFCTSHMWCHVNHLLSGQEMAKCI